MNIKIKNTKKIIVTSIIGILGVSMLIIGVVIYPIYYTGKQAIIDEIDNGTKLSGNGAMKIEGGYRRYTDNGRRTEIVLTTFDLKNPVYTLVSQLKDSKTVSQLIITLDRITLNTFSVSENPGSNYASTDNYSFEEMLAIVKKTNLVKNNPDPKKIEVRPALTEEEISKNKRQVVFANSFREDLKDYLKELGEYNNWSKEEKLRKLGEYKVKYTELKKVRDEQLKKDPTLTPDNYPTFLAFGINCTADRQRIDLIEVGLEQINPCKLDNFLKVIDQSIKDV